MALAQAPIYRFIVGKVLECLQVLRSGELDIADHDFGRFFVFILFPNRSTDLTPEGIRAEGVPDMFAVNWKIAHLTWSFTRAGVLVKTGAGSSSNRPITTCVGLRVFFLFQTVPQTLHFKLGA